MALKMLFGMKMSSGKPPDARILSRAWIRQVSACNRLRWGLPFRTSTSPLEGSQPQGGGHADPFNASTTCPQLSLELFVRTGTAHGSPGDRCRHGLDLRLRGFNNSNNNNNKNKNEKTKAKAGKEKMSP